MEIAFGSVRASAVVARSEPDACRPRGCVRCGRITSKIVFTLEPLPGGLVTPEITALISNSFAVLAANVGVSPPTLAGLQLAMRQSPRTEAPLPAI